MVCAWVTQPVNSLNFLTRIISFLFFRLALNSEVLYSKVIERLCVCLVVEKHFICEKINSHITLLCGMLTQSISKLSTGPEQISHISPFPLHMRSRDVMIYPQSKYYVSIIVKSSAGLCTTASKLIILSRIYAFKISGFEKGGSSEPSEPPSAYALVHTFKSFSNLHFLVLAFFYIRDVFGIGTVNSFDKIFLFHTNLGSLIIQQVHTILSFKKILRSLLVSTLEMIES